MPRFSDGPERIKMVREIGLAVFDGVYYRLREDVTNPKTNPWLLIGFEEKDPSDLRWIITQDDKWYWMKECYTQDSRGGYQKFSPRAFQRQAVSMFSLSHSDGDKIGAVIDHLFGGLPAPSFFVKPY